MAASMMNVSCVCGKRCLRLTQYSILRPLSTSLTQTQEREHSLEIPPKVIKIPKKKKRNSVSILKALADTVGQDPIAPHYKYVDEPFLTPLTATDKKAYSLAKASGQKAAHYVIQSYPHLFEPSKAEPHIQAFQPKNVAYQHEEDTEEGLCERIARGKPTAAYASFQKIREKGVSLGQSSYNALLDLLCWYNSKEPLLELMPDEVFYKKDVRPDLDKHKNTWLEGCDAELVFNDMEEKNSRAYNTMVRGMARHLDGKKAFDMYKEMKENNIRVELETYNAVLRSVSYNLDVSRQKWEITEGVLTDMKENQMRPNLQTFNAILFTLFKMSRVRNSPMRAMQVLNEMKKLNIEPSLSSWCYIIRLFYTDDKCQHPLMYEIVDYMKGKEYRLQHPDDNEFFVTAMAKCGVNMKDVTLAHKINDVAKFGNNMQFLGDGWMQPMYYNHYFRLISTFEELSSVIEFYESHVPHIWNPNTVLMLEILDTFELNEGYEYLPQIWSDLLLYRFSNNTDIIEKLVNIMGKKQQESKLQEQFVEVTKSIKQRIVDQDDLPPLVPRINLSGPLLGNLALINLNAGQLDEAWEFFKMYDSKKNIVQGFPSEKSLEELTKKCIDADRISKAIMSVSLMSDLAYPKTDQLLQRLADCPTLTDAQREEIASL